jgi:hypothetical protein
MAHAHKTTTTVVMDGAQQLATPGIVGLALACIGETRCLRPHQRQQGKHGEDENEDGAMLAVRVHGATHALCERLLPSASHNATSTR